MNMLTVVAVAAAYGVEKVRADGYPVDAERFDAAIRALANLSKVLDPPLSPVAPPRKEPDDGGMTATAVAGHLGLTPAAVRLAARDDRLAGEKDDNGRWRFDREAVEAWEADRGR